MVDMHRRYLIGLGSIGAAMILISTACSVDRPAPEAVRVATQRLAGSGSGSAPDCSKEDAAYQAANDALWACQDKPNADCHCQVRELQIALWNQAYCRSNTINPGDGSPTRITCGGDIPEVKDDGSPMFACDPACDTCCDGKCCGGSGSPSGCVGSGT